MANKLGQLTLWSAVDDFDLNFFHRCNQKILDCVVVITGLKDANVKDFQIFFN